jgi:hypothetical protein
MQASARIAKYISEKRCCPLLVGVPETPVHRLIIVNSPSAFCPFLHELAYYVKKHDPEVVWVMNDYTIYPPTQLRKTGIQMTCWSTLHENPYPHRLTYANLAEWHHVNWNCLSWSQPSKRKLDDGILYYGAFREHRKDLFEKYFITNLYDVKISCPSRVKRKFEDEYYADPVGPIQIPHEINRAVIHMEDKYSRRVYTSPPNRFYECLVAGAPMFFDHECLGNLHQYDIDQKWVVECPEDVALLLRHKERISDEQESLHRVAYNERRELDENLLRL